MSLVKEAAEKAEKPEEKKRKKFHDARMFTSGALAGTALTALAANRAQKGKTEQAKKKAKEMGLTVIQGGAEKKSALGFLEETSEKTALAPLAAKAGKAIAAGVIGDKVTDKVKKLSKPKDVTKL